MSGRNLAPKFELRRFRPLVPDHHLLDTTSTSAQMEIENDYEDEITELLGQVQRTLGARQRAMR